MIVYTALKRKPRSRYISVYLAGLTRTETAFQWWWAWAKPSPSACYRYVLPAYLTPDMGRVYYAVVNVGGRPILRVDGIYHLHERIGGNAVRSNHSD